MTNTLVDINILITRPKDQSAHLCHLLTAAGARVFSIPTIEIVPIKNISYLALIQKLDDYAIVIFTSVNAVQCCVDTLKSYWPMVPTSIQFAAIGAKTKAAIEEQGWHCDIYPEQNYSSEALLELDAFSEINGKKILVITGKYGRDYLTKILKSRHAIVDQAICYERKVPNQFDSAIIENHEFDFLVCTSNACLENLAKLLPSKLLNKFQHTQIIAFSNRIEAVAAHLNFKIKPIITKMATDEAIVDTIIQNTGIHYDRKD